MHRFASLVLACVLGLVSVGHAQELPEGRRIALFIYFFSKTAIQPGSFAAAGRIFRDRMAKGGDGLEVLAVTGTGADELRIALESLRLSPKDKVVRIEIDSHGTNHQVREEIRTSAGELISMNQFHDSVLAAATDITFRVPLDVSSALSEQDVRDKIDAANAAAIDAFAPLRGKLANDVEIHCRACQFFPKSPGLAQATAMILKRVFQIESGRFYGNVTNGQMLESEFWREPFWKNANLKTQGIAALFQFGFLANIAVGFYDPWIAVQGALAGAVVAKGVHMLRDRGFVANFSREGQITLAPARAKEFLKSFYGLPHSCERLFLVPSKRSL